MRVDILRIREYRITGYGDLECIILSENTIDTCIELSMHSNSVLNNIRKCIGLKAHNIFN